MIFLKNNNNKGKEEKISSSLFQPHEAQAELWTLGLH